MPTTLTIGFFVFGAVLVLIALIGGKFQIFSVVVSSGTTSVVVRFIAFILGAIFLFLATFLGLNEIFTKSADAYPATSDPVVVFEPSPIPPAQQPTQFIPPPIFTDTPIAQKPNPVDFVLSYWQNVNAGRFESSWAQLSPRFKQVMHNNDYGDYARGYQQMNLCQIVVSDVRLIRQDNYSAVVTAHFDYYVGANCNPSGYDFEMHLVYDEVSNSWLLESNRYA